MYAYPLFTSIFYYHKEKLSIIHLSIIIHRLSDAAKCITNKVVLTNQL